jgi:hypothetical protein
MINRYEFVLVIVFEIIANESQKEVHNEMIIFDECNSKEFDRKIK